MPEANDWQGMESAPKDRKIDIVAKRWNPKSDAFELRRFTDCHWFVPDPISRIAPHWHGVPHDEYRAICWREVPELQEVVSFVNRW